VKIGGAAPSSWSPSEVQVKPARVNTALFMPNMPKRPASAVETLSLS